MTRKGSDVRGATIAKAAPQVIVGLWLPDGCYYIPHERFSGQRYAIASGSTPERGLKMPTSENGGITVQGAGCGVE